MTKIESESDLADRKNPKILLSIVLIPVVMCMFVWLVSRPAIPNKGELNKIYKSDINNIFCQSTGKSEFISMVMNDGIRQIRYGSSSLNYYTVKENIFKSTNYVLLTDAQFIDYGKEGIISWAYEINIDGRIVVSYEDIIRKTEFDRVFFKISLVIMPIVELWLIYTYFISTKRQKNVIYLQDVLK